MAFAAEGLMAAETMAMVTDKRSGELVRALNWKGAFWVAAGFTQVVADERFPVMRRERE